jgi:hypothetical protein
VLFPLFAGEVRTSALQGRRSVSSMNSMPSAWAAAAAGVRVVGLQSLDELPVLGRFLGGPGVFGLQVLVAVLPVHFGLGRLLGGDGLRGGRSACVS